MQYLTMLATMSYRYRTEMSDDDDEQGRFLAILKRVFGVQPKVRASAANLIERPFGDDELNQLFVLETYRYSDLIIETTDDVVLKFCDECYKQHVDISISNTSCVRRGLVEPVVEVKLLNSRCCYGTGDDAMPRIKGGVKSSPSRISKKEDTEDDE